MIYSKIGIHDLYSFVSFSVAVHVKLNEFILPHVSNKIGIFLMSFIFDYLLRLFLERGKRHSSDLTKTTIMKIFFAPK